MNRWVDGQMNNHWLILYFFEMAYIFLDSMLFLRDIAILTTIYSGKIGDHKEMCCDRRFSLRQPSDMLSSVLPRSWNLSSGEMSVYIKTARARWAQEFQTWPSLTRRKKREREWGKKMAEVPERAVKSKPFQQVYLWNISTAKLFWVIRI